MSFRISVSDLITLSGFAWSVHKLCRDSVGDPAEATGEVPLMHAVLIEFDALMNFMKRRLAVVQRGFPNPLNSWPLNCQSVRVWGQPRYT